MVTVHLIGNAHLDPVWLWRWQAGVIEAIATCRSAADRIEEYPEFIFTRSDVWIYEQIEKHDPELFERIRRYVEAGRWQIVGGWYIQPDCNLPTEESFRKHISLGKAYFHKKFGVDVTVGYNVDSFGHNAMIPSFLSEAGYDSYVMMRPMAHEKKLPSSLFRWRSPDNREVLVWRIPRAYTESREDLTDHIKSAIDVADPNIGHVMCFYGVGNHGGGPTKRQIEWIMDHKDSFNDAKLIFSHPRAFFDAVKPFIEKIPIVEDELQYHAVGCYSVVHEIKKQMRRAEYGLISAENTISAFPKESPPDAIDKLDEAWKKTLFNQFHDIYAGTSLASAYEDARDQLGFARDTADNIIYDTLFNVMRNIQDDKWQRILVFNPSNHTFNGYLQHEPWINWAGFDGWIADENGNRVQHQRIQHESVTCGDRRLIWHAEISPMKIKIFQLRTDPAPPLTDSDLKVDEYTISNKFWIVTGTDDGSRLIQITRRSDGLPIFGWDNIGITSQYDNSDTWSHGISRYQERIAGKFRQRKTIIEESGPLRASLRIDTQYRNSFSTIWIRLYANDPKIYIQLYVNWGQKLQISKLVFPFTIPIRYRLDGIPGGYIARPQSGQEFPIVNWTLLNMYDDSNIGILCPDCFSIDGLNNTVRFTLLRCPVYAWHDPTKLREEGFYRYTDQGEHYFRFILCENTQPEFLKELALSEHYPPICLDCTKGMK